MTPAYPKPRLAILAFTTVNHRYAIADDDPDIFLLEFYSLSSDGNVYLPANPAIGKSFKFRMVMAPGVSILPNTETVNILVPSTRRGRRIFWTLSWGQSVEFIFTPSGWLMPDGIDEGPGVAYTSGFAVGSFSQSGGNGVSIGLNSDGQVGGVAVGYDASGGNSGAAFGYNSLGSTNGVAIGRDSTGAINGVAVGYKSNANSKDAAVALGYQTIAQRYREFTKGADNAATTLRSWSILDWYGNTTDATPAEILLGGTASQRCTVLANSAFMFSILVVARDNVGNVVSSWRLEGCIKRDGSSNTALVGVVTKTLTAQDAGAVTWDVAATADDTNEALVITVTGAAATTIRWNAMATISEVRF